MTADVAITLDRGRFYIVHTGATHVKDGPRHISVFGVNEDGRLSGGKGFGTSTAGLFDGLRLDEAGRTWTSAGHGFHCYHGDGTLIGKTQVPEVAANVVFGRKGQALEREKASS